MKSKRKTPDLRIRSYSSEEALRLSGASDALLRFWLREKVIQPLKAGRGRGGRKFIFSHIALMCVALELKKFRVKSGLVGKVCQNIWRDDFEFGGALGRRVDAGLTEEFADKWERFKDPHTRGRLDAYVVLYAPDDREGRLVVLNRDDPFETMNIVLSPLVPSAILINLRSIVERLEGLTGDRWIPRTKV